MSESEVPSDVRELTARLRDAHQQMLDQIGRVIVGQQDVVDQMLISLFCQGHAVLVGVPGLAKTLLVSTIARTLSLDFSRIQFTPDLMPSDITGTEVIEEDKATGQRTLRFVKGPVFANVVLADEINRTPPKTQAALLEAMQENQVTASGEKHQMPDPFFVLATQNPIEQEGTYPLPEAQLDRFMFEIRVAYPSEQEELDIVRRTTARQEVDVEPVLNADRVLEIQRVVRDVPVADHVIRYALRFVRATRIGENDNIPEFVQQYVGWGAGPRASQYLILAAKARAILDGRNHVETDDIASIAHPVLRHRLITNFNAEAEGVRPDDVIDRLLKEVPRDESDSATQRELDQVVRSE
jgi:MoxR-like ATPase